LQVSESAGFILRLNSKVSKTILVTHCGGLYCSETLRFPYFLDNRLIDGAEVVSLMCRPRFTPKKDFLILIPVNDEVEPSIWKI
jgi:hypothetical protein